MQSCNSTKLKASTCTWAAVTFFFFASLTFDLQVVISLYLHLCFVCKQGIFNPSIQCFLRTTYLRVRNVLTIQSQSNLSSVERCIVMFLWQQHCAMYLFMYMWSPRFLSFFLVFFLKCVLPIWSFFYVGCYLIRYLNCVVCDFEMQRKLLMKW